VTSSALRILHLNDLSDPRIGSSIRQMYQLAARQREAGHEAAVLTATPDRDATSPTEILGSRVYRVHSDYDPRYRAWIGLANRRALPSIARVLDEWKPDVVHSHLIHTHLSYASLRLARERGAAVVFTAHDVMTFCYQKLTCFHGGPEHEGELRDYQANWQKCIPCQRLRWRPGRNAAIRRVLERDVQRFTAVSHELARAIRANGIRVDRVIHNAIPGDQAPPSAELVRAFRREHGLAGAQVIAIAGRLHEQKGVGQLFKMLARLAPELPQLRLIVMGHRKVFDEEFAPLARELGVHERVVPTGWLDGEELACAYGATDVFVTPSICFDTFGLVNLEAMQHQKPVVATAFGGSPEVVEDGVTGFIANPFDVEDFARKIRLLVEDPALAQRMGRAGAERMRNLFRTERLFREFDEEYRFAIELAREASRSPAG
jgi:glycosyltransferase involved in cell wall biosynthesis